MSENDQDQPEVIYAVEGPINPRSGAPTLYPALGEPQAVKDLRSELAAKDARIAELTAALHQIIAGARSQGPFEGMSWQQAEIIALKALGPDVKAEKEQGK